MKFVSFLLMVVGQACLAQTTINKNFTIQPGQKINLSFDHPELIKVSTWDRNEVVISGTVSINNGENDDAFGLTGSVSNGIVSIAGEMINLKSLPQRITIVRDGRKITFKDKSEYKKYIAEFGKDYTLMSTGVEIEIVLEVKVPKNSLTFIRSVYGMVEIKNYEGFIDVVATYGGIDAALNVKSTGELIAETNYGQIYSNLEVKFDGGEVQDFHTLVTAKLGSGPKLSFESKYGNVYLRKEQP